MSANKIASKNRMRNAAGLFFLCLGACVGIIACTTRPGKPQDAATAPATFRLPEVPSIYASMESRAEYLAAHYWDHFDFRDTTLVSKPEITEQAFVDFVNTLQLVPGDKTTQALTALMDSASADTTMFFHFIELADRYLCDPNSPVRNEELYIPILRYLVWSPKLDDIHKERPRYQLELALKNRPGEVAADFTYMLSSGRKRRMHELKAEYTILFFNNPDCEECRWTKEYMAASSVIMRLVETRNEFGAGLSILAVYPDGDIPRWQQVVYPRWMINSCDAERVITTERIYDLKAIPMLYLLDKNKQVLLKDAPIEVIELWLENQTTS